MWILFAIGSSFFAGITAILAKCGIQKTDSDVATAVRTIVVLIFSWLMVPVTGTLSGIKDISGHTLLFLVLSGLATGASWLCYFHALQKGDINKVVPIDKSSTILTILLALIFLHEGLAWAKAGCVITVPCSRDRQVWSCQSTNWAFLWRLHSHGSYSMRNWHGNQRWGVYLSRWEPYWWQSYKD